MNIFNAFNKISREKLFPFKKIGEIKKGDIFHGICEYGILHIETREKVLGKLLQEIDSASPRASLV